MSKLKIADLFIEILFSDIEKLEGLKEFYCNEGNTDFKISFFRSEFINEPEGSLVLDEKIKWINNNNGEDKIFGCVYNQENSRIIYMVEIDKKYKTAIIYYVGDKVYGEYALLGPLGELIFRNFILYHQGIVVHASAIEYKGSGIIFSAPSGTGKSTQANLWKLHKGAIILNGDRPALRIIEGKPYVYGTPWSGSSPNFSNGKAPLNAIVLLEQGNKNFIKRLDKYETVLKMIPRCYLPYFDSSMMQIALDNLEKIIKITPVYLLKCKPDREAVELVYQCVK